MKEEQPSSEGREELLSIVAFFSLFFACLTVLLSFLAPTFVKPMAALTAVLSGGTYFFVILRKPEEQDHLGAYEILGQLGEGSMGVVYRARHRALGRISALKKIRSEEISNLDLGRFKREAQVLSNLESPHTIEIFDFGQTKEGELFYAMEYLQGKDLQEAIDNLGAFSFARTLYILAQAARSMIEAHAQGVVHRDLKPANLMLCIYGGSYDYVKVLDFGLAKGEALSQAAIALTGEATILGTPAYIAPESFAGSKYVTAAADVYALAAIAHFLLTTRLLFEETRPMAMVRAHMQQDPPSLAERGVQVPPEFEELLRVSLLKEPKERPTMSEFLNRVEHIAQSAPWSTDEALRWWSEKLPQITPQHASKLA